NLEGIQSRQRLVARVAPEQLRALAFGQAHVRFGQSIEDVRGAVTAEFLAVAANETIAQADEVVADVDCRADAVAAVQGFPAVAKRVVVLDVVVNEGRLVKRLDGEGNSADRIG